MHEHVLKNSYTEKVSSQLCPATLPGTNITLQNKEYVTSARNDDTNITTVNIISRAIHNISYGKHQFFNYSSFAATIYSYLPIATHPWMATPTSRALKFNCTFKCRAGPNESNSNLLKIQAVIHNTTLYLSWSYAVKNAGRVQICATWNGCYTIFDVNQFNEILHQCITIYHYIFDLWYGSMVLM